MGSDGKHNGQRCDVEWADYIAMDMKVRSSFYEDSDGKADGRRTKKDIWY